MRTGIAAAAFTLISVAGTIAKAEDAIVFVNRTNSAIGLWLWDPNRNAWVDRVPLEPSQRIGYSIGDIQQCYLAARLQNRSDREFVIGWYNFRDLANRTDFASINIDSQLVNEQKTSTYTICRPVWEIRTRTRTIYRRWIIDGECYLVPELITEQYKVCKLVPEQRTRTAIVQRLELLGGAWNVNEALTSLVSFFTLKEGAIIRYKLAARNEIRTLGNPTNTKEEIPVGIYLVWTERNQVQTSPKQFYDLFAKEKKITIPELAKSP